MKKNIELYRLNIHERDDYFQSHNTFSCQKVIIEEYIDCHDLYIEGTKTIRDKKFTKAKVKGEKYLITIKSSDKYFSSLNDVLKHLRDEYIEVHETECICYKKASKVSWNSK